MGNQTSQWFALYYLDGLDRLIKEKLRIKYYTRYMDDMILIHPDKNYLKECLHEMEIYLAKELKPVHCTVHISSNGLPEFPSAALASLDVVTATPLSAALQNKNSSFAN